MTGVFTRFITVFTGLLLLAGAADGCELDVAARGTSVADFVERTRTCVRRLPEGYRVDLAIEQEFLQRINEERANRAMPLLIERPDMLEAARFHSLDMAANDFFGHEGPDGRTPHDRIAAFDRRSVHSFSAENVAMLGVTGGPFDFGETVPRLHVGLMESPPHRKNILSIEATHIAIGVVRTETSVWVTQLFMGLEGELARAVPVRVRPRQQIGKAPDLWAWNSERIEVRRANGAHETLKESGRGYRIPPDLRGDTPLVFYGERPGAQPHTKEYIRLTGPTVTVSR